MFNAACGYAVNQINLAHPVVATVAPWLMLVWGKNQMPAPRWVMSGNIVCWLFRLGVHIKTFREHSHFSIALKRKDEHISWAEFGSHLSSSPYGADLLNNGDGKHHEDTP